MSSRSDKGCIAPPTPCTGDSPHRSLAQLGASIFTFYQHISIGRSGLAPCVLCRVTHTRGVRNVPISRQGWGLITAEYCYDLLFVSFHNQSILSPHIPRNASLPDHCTTVRASAIWTGGAHPLSSRHQHPPEIYLDKIVRDVYDYWLHSHCQDMYASVLCMCTCTVYAIYCIRCLYAASCWVLDLNCSSWLQPSARNIINTAAVHPTSNQSLFIELSSSLQSRLNSASGRWVGNPGKKYQIPTLFVWVSGLISSCVWRIILRTNHKYIQMHTVSFNCCDNQESLAF